MRIRTIIAAAVASLITAACSSLGIGSGSGSVQPLTQAQVQADVANAVYLMQAAGCVIAQAGAAAAPIISVAADDTGNQVLKAVSASGAVACQLTVPATALPVPAPASAPPATASVAAPPPAATTAS